ncbi:MAG: DUF4139 domain-containing protein [Phycisphaeraceae bacterium]
MPSITRLCVFTGLAIVLTAAPAWAQAQELGLTIYSNADPMSFDPQQFIAQQRMGYNPQFASQVPGFGVVRDTRSLDLKQGANTASFTDVAQFIDPTTVTLTDLSVPAQAQDQLGVQVVEQQFLFDLVSPEKLLEKYLDQAVTVNVNLGNGQRESVTGTLLSSTQGRLVLKTDKGVRLLSNSGDVQLGEVPGGLITKPTLQWQLWAPNAGKRTVRTSYQTDGITWRADYNLVVNQDDTQADLGAWVTIMNLSGASFPQAKLKLIAGDVQRIQQQPMYARQMQMAAAMDGAAPAGFEEKAFFEYHMYTLPRKTTIVQNSTQQLALFPTKRGVKVEKVLVYYGLPSDARYWVFPNPQQDRNLGTQSSKKVDVYMRFANREDNNLGIPLPRGKVRVFKADQPKPNAAGELQPETLEFIGEDLIDHTAKNETVLVKVGQSFDVTGERTQTDFKANYAQHWIEESVKITVRNAKDKAQKVIVRETLFRWVNWELIKKSDEFEKIDSRTIHFEVEVPAEGEKTVQYTVRYTW